MPYHKDEMTPKRRLLAAISGEEADRLPWSPFLAYFWESQDRATRDRGELRFLEDVGADPLLRGACAVCALHRKNCEIRESCAGRDRRVTWETPVGSLNETYRRSDEGNTSFLMEHPVKSPEDFKVLAYIYENTAAVPAMDDFIRIAGDTGERALLLPLIGSEGKTCFQALVEHWVGTEELAYALADFPEAVEACLAAMQRVSERTVRIAAECPAEAFIFWEDSSTTNYSPSQFGQYALPEIDGWGKLLHGAGKRLIHHACGHLRGLLPLMAASHIDMVESVSPPPTGNVELWEARAMLPGTIGLIGGIEPTVFLRSTMEELEAYVRNLIERMGKGRFILANSDSCPPGVERKKFSMVSALVRSL